MTQDEIGVMLNLRATLSEYEHFMCELSAMIERGVDVPPCGSAKFPMRDKLYAQVRGLVLGDKAMETKQGEPKFHRGEEVCDKLSKKVYRVFATNMVALQDVSNSPDTPPDFYMHEGCLEKRYDGK